MTIEEIKTSWNQGATKGNSPAHKNFEGEMAKRTVTNRAIKMFVNSSDDSAVLDNDAPSMSPAEAYVNKEIAENANKEQIKFNEDDAKAVDVEHEDVSGGEEMPSMEEAEAGKQTEMAGPNF
jgi:recombination protein RecT